MTAATDKELRELYAELARKYKLHPATIKAMLYVHTRDGLHSIEQLCEIAARLFVRMDRRNA